MSKSTLAFILLVFASLASAQTLLTTEVRASKSRWSGMATASYSSNFQEQSSYDYEALASGNLLLNYAVSGSNNLRAIVAGYQEQNRGRESRLNDTTLAWANPFLWHKGKVFSLGQQVRAILPTSRESNLRDEKRLGVSVAPHFIVNLTPVGLTGVTVSYLPQLIKNFHKYEQNRAFESNTSYSILHGLAISWSVTDHFYVQPSFSYSRSWTYEGVRKDDAYQFNTELGYVVNNELTVAAGVTNAGAVRDLEQGNDQTVELFNNRTASVYLAGTYAF